MCEPHRPFRLADDGAGGYAPELYEYSWNKRANVLYIEAPTGVGFSFSSNASKYENITDAESSMDNFRFLENWFECFDSFSTNDFYITAESCECCCRSQLRCCARMTRVTGTRVDALAGDFDARPCQMEGTTDPRSPSRF